MPSADAVECRSDRGRADRRPGRAATVQIESTWRGIDAGADRDEPGMRQLRDQGAVEGIRSWQNWLSSHRETVTAALEA
ncbi:hypothetical protein ACFYPX_25885 [Micromonospora zamorensis]|uniref:hypothetical protein n=1 Tax=Micromonospora zamorensis TaxID=709883 RepID=UPI0036BE4F51